MVALTRFDREHVELAIFRIGYLSIFVALTFPLVVVMVSSFTKAGYISFPPEQISIKWYLAFLESSTWRSAVWSSVIIGFGTTLLSTFLGVTAAYGFRQLSGTWAKAITPLVLLPILIPAVVIAIALLPFLSRLGLYRSHLGVILAHSLWATPLVFFVMQSVFDRYDWQLRDAAMDLGGTPVRTFFEVIYPSTKEGIFAAAVIAFIVSLQEFIIALFLTGQDTQTIPVLTWTSLRQSLDPVATVVSALLIAAVIVITGVLSMVIGIERLSREL